MPHLPVLAHFFHSSHHDLDTRQRTLALLAGMESEPPPPIPKDKTIKALVATSGARLGTGRRTNAKNEFDKTSFGRGTVVLLHAGIQIFVSEDISDRLVDLLHFGEGHHVLQLLHAIEVASLGLGAKPEWVLTTHNTAVQIPDSRVRKFTSTQSKSASRGQMTRCDQKNNKQQSHTHTHTHTHLAHTES